MRKKMTQREMVARYLAARKGQWIPGHELVRNASSVIGETYLIQDADTRAHELTKEGFTSTFNIYTFETEKQGKYAYFKCSKKERRQSVQGLKDWTHTPALFT